MERWLVLSGSLFLASSPCCSWSFSTWGSSQQSRQVFAFHEIVTAQCEVHIILILLLIIHVYTFTVLKIHKAHITMNAAQASSSSLFSLSLSQIPQNPQFPGPKVYVQGCQLCAHSPTCRPCLHPLPVTEALPELLGDLPGQVCSNTVWPPSLVWGESKTLLA